MIAPGTRLGNYDVIALVGAGGMGEVYRARDTRLRREVAIKVLPAILEASAERRARFESEARMLAALNYPSIAALYELEEWPGGSALVMELVEGPTLEEWLREAATRRSSGRRLPEALRIAVEIAGALGAAHAKGIVHRDLKPANVKLTTDGRVKVLDFGVAKLLESDKPPDATTACATDLRVVVGTAAYMSPEQAEGRAVDARSDIFSFGAVLYELVSGHRCFQGTSPLATMSAVLNGEPPPLRDIAPDVPRDLERLVSRCLRKDPAERWQHASDLRLALQDLARDVETADPRGSLADVKRGAAHGHVRVWGWAFAGALAAAFIAAGWFVFTRQESAGRSTLLEPAPEQLTFDGGFTTDPALSVDGRLMAFASDRSGRTDLDVWVQQLPGGVPSRVTDDPADDYDPDFSPDGTLVAFRSDREGGGIFVVPSFGGKARLIAREGREPRFSPDGKRLAYWKGLSVGSPSVLPSSVHIVSLDGGAETRIAPELTIARTPVWAPDGASLIIYGRRDLNRPVEASLDWYWTPVDTRPIAKTGVADHADLYRAAIQSQDGLPGSWSEHGVVFSDGRNLGLIPVDPASGRVLGSIRYLTMGAGSSRDPVVSSHNRLAFVSVLRERVVGRVSLGPGSGLESPAVLLRDGSQQARTSQTADGGTIVFETVSPGRREIWLKDLRTGEQRLIVRVDATVGVNATVSPDGTRIVYSVGSGADAAGETSAGSGFVVDTAGGVPRELCKGCLMSGFLSDSRRALLSTAQPVSRIGLIDVVSGKLESLLEGDKDERLDRPHASPDDRLLAFRLQDRRWHSYLIPILPGRATPRAAWQEIEDRSGDGRPAGWSPDSRVVYVVLYNDGFRCLWGQRVDEAGRLRGSQFPAAHFHAYGFGTSFGNAVSPEGFMFERTVLRGNIWSAMLRPPGR